MTEHWQDPRWTEEVSEPRESGLYLLDQELERMDKLLGRAEQDLAGILKQPSINAVVGLDTPAPESPLRARVERLRAQCQAWDHLLTRSDV